MPQFITAAIAAIGTYLGGTAGAFLIMNAAAVASGAILIGGLAYSAYSRSRAKRKATDAFNDAQQDRMVTVVSSVMNAELVLGRVRKGGSVFFRGSTGQYKATFLLGQTLAGHSCDGIEQIYLADQPVTLDSNGYVLDAPYNQARKIPSEKAVPGLETLVTLDHDPVAGSVSAWVDGGELYPDSPLECTVSGRDVTILGDPNTWISGAVIRYQRTETNSYVRVWWELGAPGAPADARAMELFPGVITAAHRGEGDTKLWTEFTFNESAFPSGLPTVTALLRGDNTIYDPRTGLTGFTENVALHMRHVYQHDSFGKSEISAAEDVRFAAEANACDLSTNYVVNGVTTTRALYKSALVAPFGTPARDLFDTLSQAMGGMWAYAGGELYLRAGVYTAPVRSFTDADIAVVTSNGEQKRQNPISITVHRERARKFNTVPLRIWDAAQDYKMAPITPLTSAALKLRDGKELVDAEVTLTAVTYAPQAQHIAGIMMRDARDPMTIRLPFKLRAYPVELFDTIELTRARNGFVSKTYMVLSREWDYSNGIVWQTLKETNAAILTVDAAFLSQGYASNTALPRPFDLEPVVLSADRIHSGTDELVEQPGGGWLTVVRVEFDAVLDESVANGGSIEFEWTPVGSNKWTRVVVDGRATQALLVGPQDGQAILVQNRVRNKLGVSDWSVHVGHLVLGKSALPSEITSFSVDGDGVATWTPVDDRDVRSGGGYKIKWQPGVNRSWGDASPLHEGLLTETPYRIEIRPIGQATYMIKAVDSSGNESENPAYSITDLGDPIVANVVVTTDYQALGFPGAITNATVSGGELLADADASPLAWNPNPATAAWTLDTNPGWTTTTYKDVTYTPDVFIVEAADEGAQLTLPHEIEATAYLISYRRDGDALAWTSDDEPAWSDDAALAWSDEEDYRPWPGTVTAREGRYELQITTQSRLVQSVVSEFAAQLDVPDIFENVGRVSILAAGTVIPATKPFREVTGIGLTLVADGGTAESVRIEDETTRTVTTRNAANVAVDGTVLATLQGY